MKVYWCDKCKAPVILTEHSGNDDSFDYNYLDPEDLILDYLKDKSKTKKKKLYNYFLSIKRRLGNALSDKNKNKILDMYFAINKKIKNEPNSEFYKITKNYFLFKLYNSGEEANKILNELEENFLLRMNESKKNTSNKCSKCKSEVTYLGKDIRPVFMEEKIMLSELLDKDLINENLWAGNSRYIVDGKNADFAKSDLYNIDFEDKRNEILMRIKENEKKVDFSSFIETNQNHYKKIEDKAIRFIQNANNVFQDSFQVVSFSGGKDSSVTSDLVQRALKKRNIMHVFGDTTLEFPTTYKYIENLKKDPNAPPFLSACNNSSFEEPRDAKFFDLTNKFGPPSRVISWCCTIFKTGPIGNTFRNIAEESPIFTYYGIRRSESNSRSNYDKISQSPKIAKQTVASPIIDWKDIDVWLYILSRNLDFNEAYRYGFTRVGCLYCPNNSKWSEFLLKIFMPQKAEKWEEFLIDFAERIGKPDPKVYIRDGKWKARQGGSGLADEDVADTIIDAKPCGLGENAKSYELTKPISNELYELFRPFGKIDKSSGNTLLNEVYVKDKNEENVFVLQGKKGQNNLKVNIIQAKNTLLLEKRIECQLRKYQSCIDCGACANVCPWNAISTNGSYQIDEDLCKNCSKCIAAFHKGCLLAKTTMDY